MIQIRLLPLLVLSLLPGAARADAVVTACATDTQAGGGVNLAQALATGGIIRFNCPRGTTIRVTGRYSLSRPTVLDGADAVVLDGRGAVGPMLRASQNIILRRITVRGFAQPPAPTGPGLALGRVGGSVLTAAGPGELDHATIETSDFPIQVNGDAVVRDSVFLGNRSAALSVHGSAFIERSRFTGNALALSIASGGTVVDSDFSGQTAGAVRVVVSQGPLEIRHSTFAGNRGGPALALSQRASNGGPATVVLRDNTFRDNDGGSGAGAIVIFDPVRQARERNTDPRLAAIYGALPPASFSLAYNRFNANRGGTAGAIEAELANTGGMNSTGDLFLGNVAAGSGGAIFVDGGAIRITHALFKNNRAGGRGAALAAGVDAQAILANVLVVGNTGPAAAIAGGAVTLANVTVADNDAAGLLLEDARARVGNTILARNRGGDCAEVRGGPFAGPSLHSDNSCPGVAMGEAFLDSFYIPVAGSPARRAGDPVLCRSDPVNGFDLPFQGRRGSLGCALGAFEGAPVRRFAGRSDRRAMHAGSDEDFSDEDGYRPPPGWRTGAPEPTEPSVPPGSARPASPTPGSTP